VIFPATAARVLKNTFAFLFTDTFYMKQILPLLLLFALLYSCSSKDKQQSADNVDEKMKMMEADRAFSRLSEEKGMKNAFLDYIDSNGVLLRPNHLPLLGADAIDYLIQQNDSAFTLKWEPKSGIVAKSGELGYTYGLYVLKPAGKDTLIYGNYVSVWKKQTDGTWKFVLDSGNEGIGE
jgi:ketosteroid isomerase-like protein